MTNCLFYGDSIIYGENDGILGGWVDILKRYYHARYNENAKEVNVFNLGIGGETTEGLLKRIDIECKARQSPIENLIFISYGANDLAIRNGQQVVPPKNFIVNLQSAISKALEFTDNIFLVTILPVSKRIEGIITSSGTLRTSENVIAYNKLIFEIASKNNIGYIDLYSIFSEQKEILISKDGVHPNEKGYELISEYVKPIINEYL